MIGRYIPDWLRHAPAPGARTFALLSGTEATMRAMLVSVWPLVMYEALGSAENVSAIYFVAGIIALSYGMMVPWLNRHIPRRWLFTVGTGFYMAGPLCAIVGGPVLTPLGMMMTGWGTVTVFICTNAYVMDFIARHELARSETLKLVFSALPWGIGPVLGVSLWKIWAPLPFLFAIAVANLLLALFWAMRLGNGKVIQQARGPAPNPLAFIGRFVRQPRLVAGFLFAVIRSMGWWVYVVYLPIFCIEQGLGDRVASVAFSISNLMLFLSPWMTRWMQGRSLRQGVQTAFACGAGFCLVSAFGQVWPPLAIAGLFATSFFLVMLDAFGGLPFLMAVKPAERTEMSAVYSSFRDVSSILTPGMAWMVLLVAPIPGIFATAGLLMAGAWVIAGQLHPRLGRRRMRASDQPVRDDEVG
ncbi:MAG: hypothetical protein RLZZ528_2311 [Pseudomonadota bacterium]|jgi:hypothetical protein